MLPMTLYRIKTVPGGASLAEAVQAPHGQTACQGYKIFDGHLYWLNNSLTQDPGRHWEYLVVQPLGDGRIDLSAGFPIGIMSCAVIDTVTVNRVHPVELSAHAYHLEKHTKPSLPDPVVICVDMRPYAEHDCEACR